MGDNILGMDPWKQISKDIVGEMNAKEFASPTMVKSSQLVLNF